MSNYTARNRSVNARVGFILDGDTDYTWLDNSTGTILKRIEILEEISSDSGDTLGEITSNRLSIALYNQDGLFSPYNEDSPFHNRIKVGTKIKVSMMAIDHDAPDTAIWDDFQTFYLQELRLELETGEVTITAYDAILYMLNTALFNTKAVVVPLNRHEVMEDIFDNDNGFLGAFTTIYNLSYTSIPAVNEAFDALQLVYYDYYVDHAYSVGNLLRDLTNALLVNLWISRDDILTVKHFNAFTEDYGEYADTFTVNDNELISATISYNVLYSIGGISWNYINIEDLYQTYVSTPIYTSEDVYIGSSALIVQHVTFDSAQFLYSGLFLYATIEGMTNNTISYNLTNITLEGCDVVLRNTYFEPHTVRFTINSFTPQYTQLNYTSADNNLIELDFLSKARYYQLTDEQRDYIADYYLAYNSSAYQEMEITTKGDIDYKLGDIIIYDSSRFGAVFEGYIKRMRWRHTGGLRCDITLAIYDTEMREDELVGYPATWNYPSLTNYPMEGLQ